jgi:hypothetical protein
MIDVRLLRCFNQQLLELKTAPSHSYARSGARFKRPYQRRSLLNQKLGGVFLLFVYALEGHYNKDGHNDDYRPDDNPWRDSSPEFPVPAIAFLLHFSLDTFYSTGYHNWILIIHIFL